MRHAFLALGAAHEVQEASGGSWPFPLMVYVVLFLYCFGNTCYKFTDESTSYHEGPKGKVCMRVIPHNLDKNAQLDAWRQRWGLLPMYWQPAEGELERDGTHLHLSPACRIEIYTVVRDLIRSEFPGARVSLCKETHTIRKALQLCNADCNCLITRQVLPGKRG
jgi:hypothetical protein